MTHREITYQAMHIKYYSKNDLSMGYNLLEAEHFLDDYDIDTIVISDINTAFEIYNIIKLLESGIKLESWSDEKYEELQGKCKALKGFVGRYFNTYDGEQFLLQYEGLDYIYHNDFVDILEKYSIYKRISEESFSSFLENAATNVRTIIKHKKLVNAFDSCIAKHFSKNIKSAELLISHYYSVNGENDHLYFPGIQFLFDKGIVVENKSGILEIDVETVRILKDLYDHEVICVAHLKDNAVLKNLISDNKVCIENTLLSKPEQNYINYVLNRREFTNGIDLRNRYIHGTNPEEERLEDYYRCLLIMLLIVIKINEEFCLKG